MEEGGARESEKRNSPWVENINAVFWKSCLFGKTLKLLSLEKSVINFESTVLSEKVNTTLPYREM